MSSDDPSPADTVAILVAAGSSSRMQAPGLSDLPRKPWIELGGRPLLAHALESFEAAPSIVEIVVVAHTDDLDRIRELSFSKLGEVVRGGRTRAASVRSGLGAISSAATLLAIHDAARPLITPELVERVLERARVAGAALPALRVVDTLKRARDDHAIETVSRVDLVRAQTPQCFVRERLEELVLEHPDDEVTDDASLWERHIGPVALVTGDESNFKVTRPADLELARYFYERRDSALDLS